MFSQTAKSPEKRTKTSYSKENVSVDKAIRLLASKLKEERKTVRTYFHSAIESFFDKKHKKTTDFVALVDFLKLLKKLEIKLNNEEVYCFIQKMRLEKESDRISIEKLAYALGKMGLRERFKASEAVFLSKLLDWMEENQVTVPLLKANLKNESCPTKVEAHLKEIGLLTEINGVIPVFKARKGTEVDWISFEKSVTEYRRLTGRSVLRASVETNTRAEENPNLEEVQDSAYNHFPQPKTLKKPAETEEIPEDSPKIKVEDQVKRGNDRAMSTKALKLIEQPSLISNSSFVAGERIFNRNHTIINYNLPFEVDIDVGSPREEPLFKKERSLVFQNGNAEFD